MSARIYTADEARALREAATPGPWHHQSTAHFRGQILAGDVNITVVGGVFSQDAVLLAAAPDLAASVEHHAARADAAEQECARLRAMVAELESLATGPRGLVVDDAACAAIDGTASIGPQGVDATEREVLP